MNLSSYDIFDLGPIKAILNGAPNEVLEFAGKQLGSDQGRRIRSLSVTYDGETLSENTEFTTLLKLSKYGETRPLVASGDMTEPGAWAISVDEANSRITLTLAGEHHEKWDNIIEIAEESGKNWNRAFGIGEFELENLLAAFKNWLKRLGVQEL